MWKQSVNFNIAAHSFEVRMRKQTLFFLVALPQTNDDINIHNFEHDLDIKVKTMLKHSVNFNTAAHGFEVRMRTQALFFLVALSRVFVINNYPTCTRKFASFLLIAKCALEENALYRVLIFFFFFFTTSTKFLTRAASKSLFFLGNFL